MTYPRYAGDGGYGNYAPPPLPLQPQPEPVGFSRPWAIFLAATTFVLGLMLGLGIGLTIGSSAKTGAIASGSTNSPRLAPTSPHTSPTAKKATPLPTGKPTVVTDHNDDNTYTWVVGDDIAAGTYTTHSTNTYCYYEVDTKAGSSDLVFNGDGFGHQTVHLKSGEQFESSDCGTWTKILG